MSSDQPGRSSEDAPLYRYEDILRAIGRYIDSNDIQDVILLQSDEGIMLRGYRTSPDRQQRGTRLIQHLFTPADLKRMDEEARQRRGRGSRLFR